MHSSEGCPALEHHLSGLTKLQMLQKDTTVQLLQ